MNQKWGKISMRKKIILIIVALVLVTTYVLLPQGRVYFAMDSRRLPENATLKLSAGEHVLQLCTRNPGLAFRDITIAVEIRSPNWTVCHELANIQPITLREDLLPSTMVWKYDYVGSFTRKVHNFTICVNHSCVLRITGRIAYWWMKRINGVGFERMLHLEFS